MVFPLFPGTFVETPIAKLNNPIIINDKEDGDVNPHMLTQDCWFLRQYFSLIHSSLPCTSPPHDAIPFEILRNTWHHPARCIHRDRIVGH
jgi:hypothetical protein